MDKLARRAEVRVMISTDSGKVANGKNKSPYATDTIYDNQLRRFYQEIYDHYPAVKAMLANINRNQ